MVLISESGIEVTVLSFHGCLLMVELAAGLAASRLVAPVAVAGRLIVLGLESLEDAVPFAAVERAVDEGG